MHVKTKDNEHNVIENKGLEMVLKCDKKSKEQRIRHVITRVALSWFVACGAKLVELLPPHFS